MNLRYAQFDMMMNLPLCFGLCPAERSYFIVTVSIFLLILIVDFFLVVLVTSAVLGCLGFVEDKVMLGGGVSITRSALF